MLAPNYALLPIFMALAAGAASSLVGGLFGSKKSTASGSGSSGGGTTINPPGPANTPDATAPGTMEASKAAESYDPSAELDKWTKIFSNMNEPDPATGGNKDVPKL